MAKKKFYDKGDAFQAFPPDNSMMGLSADQSMFGFPASSKVISYPERKKFNQMGGQDRDSISGTDYEMDLNVAGLNRNKSNQRF